MVSTERSNHQSSNYQGGTTLKEETNIQEILLWLFNWKDKETFKKEGGSSFKSHEKGTALSKNNSNPTLTSSKTSYIKCYKCLGKGHIASQCPNKRTMVAWVMGISLVHLLSSSSFSSESGSGCDVQHPKGDLLMVRMLVGSVCKDRNETQMENIFHTRCMVMRKICSLIIDGDSCTNVASLRLIENDCR